LGDLLQSAGDDPLVLSVDEAFQHQHSSFLDDDDDDDVDDGGGGGAGDSGTYEITDEQATDRLRAQLIKSITEG
jgi:hypothetical protein